MSPAGLRSLAALIRSCGSLRAAIARWPHTCPSGERRVATQCARLLALGASPADALQRAGAPAHVVAAVEVIGRTGGSIATLLEDLAADEDARAALEAEARAATGGAVLSGRMMSWLPFAVVPFLPVELEVIRDPGVFALVTLGVLLLMGGTRRIRKLAPDAPGPDPAASLAALAAAAVRGGATLHAVLSTCAAGGLGGDAFARAHRQVALGAAWADALLRSGDEGFVALGDVLRTTSRTGGSVAPALKAFAAVRRAGHAAAFHSEMRKAPVRMVVPLALAVLPGFVLIAFGPMIGTLGGP